MNPEVLRITLKEFKRKMAADEPVDPRAILCKAYVADSIKADGASTKDHRKFAFVVSTGAIDRDGDSISVDGWALDNFRKAGGPVLFGHDAKILPVAKTPVIGVVSGALKSQTEFTPRGAYPFGDMVGDLVEFGSLKCTSVGFRPLDATPKGTGLNFTKQELLEYSILPIPSNPEALLEAKGFGIDLSPYADWCERLLSESKGPGLWIPKEHAERVLKMATGEPVSTSVSVSIKAADDSGVHKYSPNDAGVCSGCGKGKGGHFADHAPKDIAASIRKAMGACDPSVPYAGDAPITRPMTPTEILAATEAANDRMDERWQIQDALTTSLRSIQAYADEDERQTLINQAVQQFVGLYLANLPPGSAKGFGGMLKPRPKPDGQAPAAGAPPAGEKPNPFAKKPPAEGAPAADDKKAPPKAPPAAGAPAAATDAGQGDAAGPDHQADGDPSDLPPALQDAATAMMSALDVLMGTPDPAARANGLKQALEAFAAVFMQVTSGVPAAGQQPGAPPQPPPDPAAMTPKEAAAFLFPEPAHVVKLFVPGADQSAAAVSMAKALEAIRGLSKAGRVLSAVNEEALRKAVAALEDVLSKLPTEEAEPVGRASMTVDEALAVMQPAATPKGLTLPEDASVEDLIQAEFGVSAEALKGMLREAHRGLVTQEVQRLTGRLPD